jgi:transcription elongation GreA/GreB family factor
MTEIETLQAQRKLKCFEMDLRITKSELLAKIVNDAQTFLQNSENEYKENLEQIGILNMQIQELSTKIDTYNFKSEGVKNAD